MSKTKKAKIIKIENKIAIETLVIFVACPYCKNETVFEIMSQNVRAVQCENCGFSYKIEPEKEIEEFYKNKNICPEQ